MEKFSILIITIIFIDQFLTQNSAQTNTPLIEHYVIVMINPFILPLLHFVSVFDYLLGSNRFIIPSTNALNLARLRHLVIQSA